MPRIHLIEGPVGAGKSTYARAMAARLACVHIALDEWFAQLFSPDRPDSDFVAWYLQRKDRLLDLIWAHAQSILETDTDVALELGLIQRQARMEFYERMHAAGVEFTVHVLDAPIEERRARVRRRNTERGPTFSMVVPDHIFEVASGLWEPLDDVELDRCEVVFVNAESPRGSDR